MGTTYFWRADSQTGVWTDTNEWSTSQGDPVDMFPVTGDTAAIGAGTVELDIAEVIGFTIDLYPPIGGSGNAVVLTGTNVDLGDATQLLTMANPGRFGPLIYDVVGTGTLNDAPGTTALPAMIDFAAAPLTIEISELSTSDPTGVFTNDGTVEGGALTIAPGPGTPSAEFVNNTTVDATGPLDLAAGATLDGTGVVNLDGTTASALLDGAVGTGQTFVLVNVPSDHVVTDTLTIGTLAQFQGTIELSREGNVVILGETSSVQGYAGGVLTFNDGAALDVVPVQDADGIGAYVIPATVENPVGETVVFADVLPCFCAGSRIATVRGDVPVEDVRAGDTVVLARGGTARVAWVGGRTVSCARHPKPHDVWPVRICAGAIAPGAPRRDLWLSPDHAILVAGHLVPVRHLLNGATVAQPPAAQASYHHIELARHDLLLAEGLAAESYLDTGNRAAFAGNRVMALHPDFARTIWAEAGCAPLVQDGAALAEAWRVGFRQAGRLGWRRTRDPALRVLAEGRRLRLASDTGSWHVKLPPGVRQVLLRSRAWVPAAMRPGEGDRRNLGVAIARLWLDGREVSVASPALARGWHAPEPAGRWTDGDAVLDVAGARKLGFTLAMVGEYWREPAAARADARRSRSGSDDGRHHHQAEDQT